MWQIRFPINRSVIVWWTAIMLFWLPNLWIFSQKGQSLLFLTSGNSCSVWFENGPIAYCKLSLNLRQVRQKNKGNCRALVEQRPPGPLLPTGWGPAFTGSGCSTQPGHFPVHPFLLPLPFLSWFFWPSYYSVNYSVALSNKLILV